MTPVKYALSSKKGTTFRKKWYLFDKDKKPLDFSDYTARMQIKVDFASDAIIELTTENDGIILTENCIELFISDSDTSSLFDPGSYKYDIEIIAGDSGDVSCPFFGSFKVTDEVTR